ncbi:TIR domain-containing protein [Teredinibacter turnerae]|uniref:TIR domain-containing protein n=1 Tax=Teredinibacter turnerae TaxID=2426 RepID=UPI000696FBD1|nr:TIR domain-containing protein [Teredinibacter turnerae]
MELEVFSKEDWQKVDPVKLSELLRERLREREITITQMSESLDTSRQLLAMIIHGKRRPSPTQLHQILDYLEISKEELPPLDVDKKQNKGNKIFISYSHRDKTYLDRLMTHLRPLQKQGLIDAWADTRLQAGDKWKKEIENALKDSRVAILLISADFLASDFIIDNELPPLLQRAENKGTTIIPVILKPCRFLRDRNLREFHSVNIPDEPISIMNENERELTYDTVAQRIEDLFDEA